MFIHLGSTPITVLRDSRIELWFDWILQSFIITNKSYIQSDIPLLCLQLDLLPVNYLVWRDCCKKLLVCSAGFLLILLTLWIPSLSFGCYIVYITFYRGGVRNIQVECIHYKAFEWTLQYISIMCCNLLDNLQSK